MNLYLIHRHNRKMRVHKTIIKRKATKSKKSSSDLKEVSLAITSYPVEGRTSHLFLLLKENPKLVCQILKKPMNTTNSKQTLEIILNKWMEERKRRKRRRREWVIDLMSIAIPQKEMKKEKNWPKSNRGSELWDLRIPSQL